MSQPCLRNMSCKCPLCAGEDLSELLALTKTISSNIQYGDGDEGDEPPPPARGGFMANSPPPAPRKTFVANSPPVQAAKRAAAAPKVPPLELKAAETAPPPRASPTPSDEPSPSQAPRQTSDEPPLAFEALEAKVADKNWKVRKEAYDDMKLAFETGRGVDGGNPIEFFGKMVDDSNAAAMEAGLAAVLAYTKEATPQQWSNSVIARTMTKVVDKCFTGRPGTVKLAEELVLEYIHQGGGEDTIAALIEGTKNKKPKAPPLCVSLMLEALKTFGPRVVPVPPLKAALPALCESTVNNVRPTALKVICELYRWTGPPLVQDIVNGLRPAQKTEYEELIKDITPGQATVTRYVKGKEPRAAPAPRGAPGRAAAAAPVAATMDPRDFAETIDLLAKLPKTEFKAKLALPKWSEKVAALQIILDTVGSVPKLAYGDFGDLVHTLKLCMQDANVNITAKSIEVLGVLADGVRKPFSQYARLMLPLLLKKLSDKKSLILNATHQTLDMFLQHALPLDAMMDEIKLSVDGATNKIPAARGQTIAFLQRAIAKKWVNVMDAALIKTLGELFASGIDDSDPGLRKAGVEAMVTLVESSDSASRMVKATLDGLEKRQPRSYRTIEAAMGSAGSSASSDTSSSAPTMPASVPKTAVPKPLEAKSTPKPAAGPPSRLAAGKKPAPAGKGPAAKAPIASSSSETMTLSSADAEQMLAELDLEQWSSIVSGFGSAKWSERKASFELLEEVVKGNPDLASTHTEALVMYAYGQTKEFRESNVQVLKSAFQALATISDACADVLPKSVVSFLVPCSIEKIGDRKISDVVKLLLGYFCEHVGPAYVLGCVYAHMPNVKAVLALIDCLTFFSECIADFGVALCDPRALIDFVKGAQGLESSNPKCRIAAMSVFGTMYSQLGPALRPLLGIDSWKPALASSAEAEFKKVGYSPATATASISRKLRHVEDNGGSVSLAAALGRVDISTKISKEMLADMQSEEDKAAWKKRLAAMEAAQRLCEEAGMMIELTKPVIEVMKALKGRLADSNANLKVKAVQVIGVYAESIGPSIAKLSKGMGANIVSGVSDNKKNMQTACVETLNKWVLHEGATSAPCLESLLPFVAEGLKNTVGRAELLGWTVPHTESVGTMDLRCLIEPTIDCLQDKASDAREKAQLLLIQVFRSVGKEAVYAGCRDVLPAKMRTLKPIIDKACQAATVDTAPIAEVESKPPPPPKVAAPAPPAAPTRQNSLTAPAPVAKAPKKEEAALLLSSDKMTRLDRNRKNKWIFDATDAGDLNARKAQVEAEWGPYMSADLRAKLFSASPDKIMEGIDDLSKCVTDQPRDVHTSLDLIMKWSTLRIVDNNVQVLAKMLDFLVKLLTMVADSNWELDDVEAGIFLPYLCQESGQQKPRFRLRCRDALYLVVDVYPSAKYVPFLLDCVANSKNTKSRIVCLETLEYIVQEHGYAAVGKKCLREMAKCVDCNEKDVREAAIQALVVVYTQVTDPNIDRFFVLCNVTSQKAMDLINLKIKYHPTDRPTAKAAPVQDEPAEEPTASFEAVKTPLPSPKRPAMVRTPSKLAPPTSIATPTTIALPSPARTLPTPTKRKEPSPIDVRVMLFPSLQKLVASAKELTTDPVLFEQGKDALKTLYVMASKSTSAEQNFLQDNINDVLVQICAIMHASFGKLQSSQIELYVLSLCLSTIANLLKHDNFAARVQRFAIERLVLESCFGLLDPRIEDTEASFAKRVMTALNKLAMTVAYQLRVSEVLPAMLNLLERIVHDHAPEYTLRDAVNRGLKKPTLERLVSKLLIKTARRELGMPEPFLNVDVSGLLHSMHSFFATFPEDKTYIHDAARNAIKANLKFLADHCATSGRRAVFEAALRDVPLSSPIHAMLTDMQYDFGQPARVRNVSESVDTLGDATADAHAKKQALLGLVDAKQAHAGGNLASALAEKGLVANEEARRLAEELEPSEYARGTPKVPAILSTPSRLTAFSAQNLTRSAFKAPEAPVVTEAPPVANPAPPKSLALLDLKQRLARIQMQ
ncbi:hypothetical protein SDRG_11690 [Saprolegnia diclina VS20]|uniref:TOG domain-containing protein n=1 Tax=Saprolegnia diclina (strain VS20) TaxID=1156394 RepID=T0QAT2_SAPDV|nr:hypothetical protein SDRG_11690 [Saprolegnia diclina VS20]EQC30635.1 hypothetical protein SDRG_11690 [Saprolegnia diclina VS20]|eukprot:XP_008615961.1 hypothetical protein SDRG_11690 [Saprolegnia diclina VS20]